MSSELSDKPERPGLNITFGSGATQDNSQGFWGYVEGGIDTLFKASSMTFSPQYYNGNTSKSKRFHFWCILRTSLNSNWGYVPALTTLCVGEEVRCLTMFDRPESNQEMRKDQIPDKLEGTGSWFLNDPEYRKWKDSPSSCMLLLTGPAYQGKSVLARHVAEDLLLTGTTVCCFFFSEQPDEARSLTHAMSVLLHELFRQRPELLKKSAVCIYFF
jgi:hypothetical protein